MNLVLTKECSKRCSFCFTGAYDAGTEMSLEFIDKLLSHFFTGPNIQGKRMGEDVKLLGGEPTQHRRFTEIVELFEKRDVEFRLISNLLYPTKIRKFLSEHMGSLSSVLCNGMELDEKNRIKLFKTNLDTYRNMNSEGLVAIALTIDKDSTIEKYRNYIRFLKSELQDFPQWVRLGLDLSGMYILNNTYLGDIIRVIDEEIPEASKNIVFDCQVPPCIWSYDPTQVLHNFTGLYNSCDSVCLDIFYDGSAIQCYQAQNIKIDNIFNFNSPSELYYEFRKLYKQNEKKVTVPQECESCRYYLDNVCRGICVGCHNEGKSNQLAKEISIPLFDAPTKESVLQIH